MTIKNLLDLRKKDAPRIIERIIFKKRSWYSEALRTLAVIVIVSTVIYGVSKADTFVSSTQQSSVKNFSAIGVVSNVSNTTISIDAAKGSDETSNTSYTFDVSSVTKVETKSYIPLTLSDIHVGDRIVIQGVDNEGNITIRRIISFSVNEHDETLDVVATSTDTVATSTATTTETTGATTTEEVSTSTEATTTTDTSSTPSSPTIIDTIKDVVSDVVDAITGTTTSTSTETVSTTTDTTATTTVDTATSTEATTTTDTASSTPTIIETIVDAVKDTINTVVDAVTGNGTTTDTLPASETSATSTQ